MDRRELLERAIARKLKSARLHPPTFLRQLLRWSSLPGLVVVGSIGTVLLTVLAQQPNSAITSTWPIGFATFFLGAVFRDMGTARRAASLWVAQSRFIDWEEVEKGAVE